MGGGSVFLFSSFVLPLVLLLRLAIARFARLSAPLGPGLQWVFKFGMPEWSWVPAAVLQCVPAFLPN